jgi:hypothetical protein
MMRLQFICKLQDNINVMKRKSSEDESGSKIKKIHKICNALQKRNHMSDQKRDKCIIGIKRRWHVK